MPTKWTLASSLVSVDEDDSRNQPDGGKEIARDTPPGQHD
jgi:hypothetical protein